MLILAVIDGTADNELAHAIPMATRADPSGQRTIQVYTKMDLQDAKPGSW